jgi:diguanylate cyclase (GGDEF)-like protein
VYTYFTAPRMDAPGVKPFRTASILLAVAYCHQTVVFFYIHLTGRSPAGALYVPYQDLVDFGLQTTLAFSAISIWVGHLNQRVRGLSEELIRVQKRASRSQDVDSLTGLLNQAALSRRLDSEAGFVGAVTVCDLNNFKAVNDRYGHMVGDKLLSNIGHLIRSSIRQEDEAFRWGGDEFVIIFCDGNLPMVQARMQQLQERLMNFRVRGLGILPITMSWGAAEAAGRSLREVLDQADHGMYAMKRNSHEV